MTDPAPDPAGLLFRAQGRCLDAAAQAWNRAPRCYDAACYDAAADLIRDLVLALDGLPQRPTWQRWGARFANLVQP